MNNKYLRITMRMKFKIWKLKIFNYKQNVKVCKKVWMNLMIIIQKNKKSKKTISKKKNWNIMMKPQNFVNKFYK